MNSTPAPLPPAFTAERSPAAPKPHRAWYQRPSGLTAALIVAGSFALWIYAFSGVAKKDPPDTLRDQVYAAKAEAICAPTLTFINSLPPAPAAKTPQQRAAVLDQANQALTQLVPKLRAIAPDNQFDRAIVDAWLRDWDQYLIDRGDYQRVLATGTDAQFTLTAKPGGIYTKSMDNLAKVNAMASCATPGDV